MSRDGRRRLRYPGGDAPPGDLSLPRPGYVPGQRGGRSRPGDLPPRLPRPPGAPPRRERTRLAVRHREQRREEPLPRRVPSPPGSHRGEGDPHRDRRGGTRGRDAIQRGPDRARHRRRRIAAQAAPRVHPSEGPRPRLRRHRPEPRLLAGQRAGARVPGPAQDPSEPERVRAAGGERRAMTRKPSVCQEIEPALLATVIGDADTATAARVEAHARTCAPCRQDLVRYRAIEDAVGAWRGAPAPAEELAHARLESRLAALRRRTLLYRIFPSPLGPILIARSEEGVSCVEYLTGGADFAHSRLSRDEGIEALLDGAEVEALYRDLLEYVEGRRTRLEWPLDLRLARSEFHRTVLETTARIPYGAVRSYAGVARELGKPSATRAVAQALRWNPLPIVVPCHRVIRASGGLTARVERRRAAVIARQIELTDAIHREVGALVAPWVMRRPGGAWRVRIAVPFERPAVVEAIVAVVRRTFTGRFDLVLTPQENVVRRGPRPLPEGREGRAVSWA